MQPITYQRTSYKIADFLGWQKSGGLILSPKFQRRSVWKAEIKSYLIDTVARGLPIPIIFLRDRRINPDKFDVTREVIDGQQRIRTVLSYIAPESLLDFDPKRDSFTVKKVHNELLAGKKFIQLDPEIQTAILEYEFTVHVLPSRTDDREVIQIFHRMNSTTNALNRQELRNAEFFGSFKTIAYELAAEHLDYWRRWSIFTEDDISRMREVRLTSELMLMIIEGKITSYSDKFLDDAYRKYDESFEYESEVKSRFYAVMESIENSFGSRMSSLVFRRKTLIYTFFVVIYQLEFGISSKISQVKKPHSLNSSIVEKIIRIGEKLSTKDNSLPESVVKALDSRRDNESDRKTLYNYISGNLS